MDDVSKADLVARIRNLPIWTGSITPQALDGGITNLNFVVEDKARKFLVRVGEDIPVHQVMRFNELAASKAAHAAGISPCVVHHEHGILVLEFIESHTFNAGDVQQQKNLEKILPLLKTCHHEIPNHLRGPVQMFWVFHVIRDYIWTLRDANSSHLPILNDLAKKSEALESVSMPIDLVFGHNDLLPANILDDGKRLWLIDWDYAGFNSPLFDLGGLASNNELSEQQEIWLLENYFERPADDALLYKYQAMKYASLLRETLWSMVSEIHSNLDFDYAGYTQENLTRFSRSFEKLKKS